MIHCFGDSWVQGIGTEWEPGQGRISMDDRYNDKFEWWKVYRKYSWSGVVQKLFDNKVKIQNYGSAGYSNEDIYRTVIESLWEEKIKKGDFVIVSFSSIVRQNLPFFYVKKQETGFINYSNSCLLQYKDGKDNGLHWIDSIWQKDLQDATKDAFKDYIVNRFSYDFLYEMSMNYILNLQVYFEKLGIEYMFVNAFENVVSKDNHLYKYIKQDKWILPEYTLQEYLVDKAKDFDKSKGYSVWEDDEIHVERNEDGPHPNRIGHQMLGELIYEHIKDKPIKYDGII